MLFWRRTSQITGEKNGISELKKIKIGGIDQWLLIRGKSRSNPILLFLHGGPGSAQIAVAARYQAQLEEHFIVVNWDQRGAGLSYSKEISKESMTVDRFIQDTKELIDSLTRTYGKQKIFLAGHSWGSILGVLIAHKFPEVIEGYAGVGQAADLEENERLAYDYVYNYAEKSNNKRAEKELRAIGRPPYKDLLEGTRVRSKWTGRFNAMFHNLSITSFMLSFLISQEYNLADGVRFLRGSTFSFDSMWPEIMKINLFELVKALEVPVYFLLGRYDFTTPYDIAITYCEKLNAPHKEIIWFENSAHCMPFEEPEKFQRVLIEKLKVEKE
jgi:pimeloyl-ACP methyl ester carboxylesterase